MPALEPEVVKSMRLLPTRISHIALVVEVDRGNKGYQGNKNKEGKSPRDSPSAGSVWSSMPQSVEGS